MDKLIQMLQDRGILQKLPDKRLTTTPLSITQYIELVINTAATGKSLTASVGAAIETYLERNREINLRECRARAMSAGKPVEEYIADLITQRLGE